MNLDYSDEQLMLRDSVERLVQQRFAFQPRAHEEAGTYDAGAWSAIADLGLLGIPFAEADGGLGGNQRDVAIVMEAFGRGLVKQPYLASVVLAGGAVAIAGSPGQRAAILPELAGGALKLSLAHAESGARSRLDHVTAQAKRSGDGWSISGEKTLVLDGDKADRLVVSARNAEGAISLFLVEANVTGLSRRPYRLQDGSAAADIRLDNVTVSRDALLGGEGQGLSIIEDVIDAGIGATSAEAIGVMQDMLDLTVDYIKTRHQFGVPLASFQVLQHRCVDMLVAVDQARSMALLATTLFDLPREERRRNMAAVKVQVARSLRYVSQQAVQLHGGIGMTLEYKLGHLFLRAAVLEMLFGDGDHHLARLADAGGLIGPEE
jgi:alkylation response protein AidB-like acyl-CoA dehydrogenase